MRGWAYVALGALVFAYAFLIQPTGDNQKAHYALVRALADGRPTVDEVRTNPNLRTIDVTEHGGHLYAAKSPGYAVFSLPAYLLLERLGVETRGDTKRILWGLHLWTTVLPALVLLLLVRKLADEVEPGLGIAAAVVLGVSTLVLPFATLFFSHVLTATLVFGSFALLWLDRARGPRLWTTAAAGLLAGFAAVIEASTAMVAVVLWAYAAYGAARRGWVARAFAFGAAFVVGIAPSPAFNWWALGSPFSSPYEGWHYPGRPDPVNSFGFGVPTPNSLLLVLLHPTGLVLLAAGIAGTILLLRRRRAEAVVSLTAVGLFVLANSMSPDVLGGASPGPRYLVPVFPFLAIGVAVALRHFRGETIGLALAGAVLLSAATITSPLAAFDEHVIQRLRDHSVVRTALELVGVESGYAVLIFLAAVALAVVGAALAARLTITVRDAFAAALTAAVFAVLATQTPRLLAQPAPAAELAVAAILVAAGVAAVVAARRAAPASPPGFQGRMEADRGL